MKRLADLVKAPIVEIENPDNCSSLDLHFGFDVRKSLVEIEAELFSRYFEIVVKPKDEKDGEEAEDKEKHLCFRFKLTDENTSLKIPVKTTGELVGLPELVVRVQALQTAHHSLLDKITESAQHLQTIYSENDFNISINARKAPSNQYNEPIPGNVTPPLLDNEERQMPQAVADQLFTDKPENLQPQLENNEEIDFINNPFFLCTDEERFRPENADFVTRELCNAIFSEEVLATHTIDGESSNGSPKGKLDAAKVEDIIFFVCGKFGATEEVVRSVISKKCAEAERKLRGNQKPMPSK